MIQTKRILSTTFKDIRRNKWVSCTSIAVLGLSFLVLLVFLLFSFVASKLLHFVETRPHIEAFFKPEVPEEEIFKVKATLENSGKVEYVEYTNQKSAAEYLRKKYADYPYILESIRDDLLPPSLAVRAKKIDYVKDVNDIIKQEAESKDYIYKISYNEDTTNLLADLLTLTKCGGIVLITFLIVVIFLIILITIENNIKIRAEEIKIMQLVGGGTWFIRLPFILQGIIFGTLSALFAFFILAGFGVLAYFLKDQSPTLTFILQFFSDISWPTIDLNLVLISVSTTATAGGVIGGLNSLIAVYKYFK